MILLLLAACLDPDAAIDASRPEPFEFEVPKGATASGLGPKLIDAELVPGEMQWKLFTKQTDMSCLKAGRFEVSRAMSLNELRDTLCGAPLADDVAFTVVEGWRIRDIDAALVDKGWIDPGEYAAMAEGKTVASPFEVSAKTYEGYLYPETYMVAPGDKFDAANLVKRQLQTFQKRFLAEDTDLGKRSLDDIVVMASMLEREEPKPKNRPLVAGILWKRIDTNNALGVDATSRYTLDDWNDRRAFLKNLKNPDEPYNTRLKKGLPPTAIGNPTVSSLEAAVSPKESVFWYYLHDADGELHPARNAAEHEANRAKYDVY